MKNPDTYEIDPEDIFEELDPTEPDSLDARIRSGDEIDADELEDEDWESLENYVEHLDDQKADQPERPPEARTENPENDKR